MLERNPRPLPASMLYEDTAEVDLSAVLDNFAMVPSPWIRVRLGGKLKWERALIDEGSECNIMPLSVIAQLGLPFRGGVHLGMRSVGGRTEFHGICDRIEVNVYGIVCEMDFLVCPTAGCPLILGRPWTRRNRLRVVNCDDGSWEGQIFAADGTNQTFVATKGTADCRTLAEVERDLSIAKRGVGV
jgi:hypothetical protein